MQTILARIYGFIEGDKRFFSRANGRLIHFFIDRYSRQTSRSDSAGFVQLLPIILFVAFSLTIFIIARQVQIQRTGELRQFAKEIEEGAYGEIVNVPPPPVVPPPPPPVSDPCSQACGQDPGSNQCRACRGIDAPITPPAPPPAASCGDGTCSSGESATTCPADCRTGALPPPPPPPSTPKSGGGCGGFREGAVAIGGEAYGPAGNRQARRICEYDANLGYSVWRQCPNCALNVIPSGSVDTEKYQKEAEAYNSAMTNYQNTLVSCLAEGEKTDAQCVAEAKVENPTIDDTLRGQAEIIVVTQKIPEIKENIQLQGQATDAVADYQEADAAYDECLAQGDSVGECAGLKKAADALKAKADQALIAAGADTQEERDSQYHAAYVQSIAEAYVQQYSEVAACAVEHARAGGRTRNEKCLQATRELTAILNSATGLSPEEEQMIKAGGFAAYQANRYLLRTDEEIKDQLCRGKSNCDVDKELATYLQSDNVGLSKEQSESYVSSRRTEVDKIVALTPEQQAIFDEANENIEKQVAVAPPKACGLFVGCGDSDYSCQNHVCIPKPGTMPAPLVLTGVALTKAMQEVTQKQLGCTSWQLGALYNRAKDICEVTDENGIIVAAKALPSELSFNPLTDSEDTKWGLFAGMCPEVGMVNEGGKCVATDAVALQIARGECRQIAIGVTVSNQCEPGYRCSNFGLPLASRTCVPDRDLSGVNLFGVTNEFALEVMQDMATDAPEVLNPQKVYQTVVLPLNQWNARGCADKMNSGIEAAGLCKTDFYKPVLAQDGRYYAKEVVNLVPEVYENARIQATYDLYDDKTAAKYVDTNTWTFNEEAAKADGVFTKIDQAAQEFVSQNVSNNGYGGTASVTQYAVDFSWVAKYYDDNDISITPDEMLSFDTSSDRWVNGIFNNVATEQQRDNIIGTGVNSLAAQYQHIGIDITTTKVSDITDPTTQLLVGAANQAVFDYNEEMEANWWYRNGQGVQNAGAFAVGAATAILAGGTGGASLSLQIPVDLAYDFVTTLILDRTQYTASERLADNVAAIAETNGDVASVADTIERSVNSAKVTEYGTYLVADIGLNIAGEAVGSFLVRSNLARTLLPDAEVAQAIGKGFSAGTLNDAQRIFTSLGENVHLYGFDSSAGKYIPLTDLTSGPAITRWVIVDEVSQKEAKQLVDAGIASARPGFIQSVTEGFDEKKAVAAISENFETPAAKEVFTSSAVVNDILTRKSPIARIADTITGENRPRGTAAPVLLDAPDSPKLARPGDVFINDNGSEITIPKPGEGKIIRIIDENKKVVFAGKPTDGLELPIGSGYRVEILDESALGRIFKEGQTLANFPSGTSPLVALRQTEVTGRPPIYLRDVGDTNLVPGATIYTPTDAGRVTPLVLKNGGQLRLIDADGNILHALNIGQVDVAQRADFAALLRNAEPGKQFLAFVDEVPGATPTKHLGTKYPRLDIGFNTHIAPPGSSLTMLPPRSPTIGERVGNFLSGLILPGRRVGDIGADIGPELRGPKGELFGVAPTIESAQALVRENKISQGTILSLVERGRGAYYEVTGINGELTKLGRFDSFFYGNVVSRLPETSLLRTTLFARVSKDLHLAGVIERLAKIGKQGTVEIIDADNRVVGSVFFDPGTAGPRTGQIGLEYIQKQGKELRFVPESGGRTIRFIAETPGTPRFTERMTLGNRLVDFGGAVREVGWKPAFVDRLQFGERIGETDTVVIDSTRRQTIRIGGDAIRIPRDGYVRIFDSDGKVLYATEIGDGEIVPGRYLTPGNWVQVQSGGALSRAAGEGEVVATFKSLSREVSSEGVRFTEPRTIGTWFQDTVASRFVAKPASIDISGVHEVDADYGAVARVRRLGGKQTEGVAYRLVTPANADSALQKQIREFNGLLDEFEAGMPYEPAYFLRPEQVDLLTRPENILQLKAGGGKTTVVGPMLGLMERRSVHMMPTSADANSYVNDLIKWKPLYDKKGITMYFFDNKRGFLEVSPNFNRVTARSVSTDVVEQQARLAGRSQGRNGLLIITESSDAVWGTISGRKVGATGAPAILNRLLFGDAYGAPRYMAVADELGSVINMHLSVSEGTPIPINKLTDTISLRGLSSGEDMVRLYQEVGDIDAMSELRTLIQDRLAARAVTKDLFFEYTDPSGTLITRRFWPKDEALIGRSYAGIVEQTMRDIPEDTPIKPGLSEILTKLQGDPTNPSLWKEVDLMLQEGTDNQLNRAALANLSFRKASLEARWYTLSRVPGNDFGQEGADIVLRRAGGTTGEVYQSAAQRMALQDEGTGMLEAAGRNLSPEQARVANLSVNRGTLTSFGELSLTPDSDQMAMREFFLKLRTFKGYDATPTTAANSLGLPATALSERPPDPTRLFTTNVGEQPEVLIHRALGEPEYRSSLGDNALAVVIGDNSGPPHSVYTNALVNDMLGRNAGDEISLLRTKFITEPNGAIRSEFFVERVVRRADGAFERVETALDSQDGWNLAVREKLAANPKTTLIVYEGRTRAVDLKVDVENKNVRWMGIAGDENTMEDITQMIKRNRVLAKEQELLASGWTPEEIRNASDYTLLVRTNKTGLTTDNVIDGYFRPILDEKLATDRFESAIRGFAQSQEQLLREAREAILTGVRSQPERVRISSEFDQLIAEAKRIEREVTSEIQRTPIAKDAVPGEIYRRGQQSFARLTGTMKGLEEKYSGNFALVELRKTFGLDRPYISETEFFSLYNNAPEAITSRGVVGPGHIAEYWAKTNDPSSVPVQAWHHETEIDTTRLAQVETTAANAARGATVAPPTGPNLLARLQTAAQTRWANLQDAALATAAFSVGVTGRGAGVYLISQGSTEAPSDQAALVTNFVAREATPEDIARELFAIVDEPIPTGTKLQIRRDNPIILTITAQPRLTIDSGVEIIVDNAPQTTYTIQFNTSHGIEEIQIRGPIDENKRREIANEMAALGAYTQDVSLTVDGASVAFGYTGPKISVDNAKISARLIAGYVGRTAWQKIQDFFQRPIEPLPETIAVSNARVRYINEEGKSRVLGSLTLEGVSVDIFADAMLRLAASKNIILPVGTVLTIKIGGVDRRFVVTQDALSPREGRVPDSIAPRRYRITITDADGKVYRKSHTSFARNNNDLTQELANVTHDVLLDKGKVDVASVVVEEGEFIADIELLASFRDFVEGANLGPRGGGFLESNVQALLLQTFNQNQLSLLVELQELERDIAGRYTLVTERDPVKDRAQVAQWNRYSFGYIAPRAVEVTNEFAFISAMRREAEQFYRRGIVDIEATLPTTSVTQVNRSLRDIKQWTREHIEIGILLQSLPISAQQKQAIIDVALREINLFIDGQEERIQLGFQTILSQRISQLVRGLGAPLKNLDALRSNAEIRQRVEEAEGILSTNGIAIAKPRNWQRPQVFMAELKKALRRGRALEDLTPAQLAAIERALTKLSAQLTPWWTDYEERLAKLSAKKVDETRDDKGGDEPTLPPDTTPPPTTPPDTGGTGGGTARFNERGEIVRSGAPEGPVTKLPEIEAPPAAPELADISPTLFTDNPGDTGRWEALAQNLENIVNEARELGQEITQTHIDEAIASIRSAYAELRDSEGFTPLRNDIAAGGGDVLVVANALGDSLSLSSPFTVSLRDIAANILGVLKQEITLVEQVVPPAPVDYSPKARDPVPLEKRARTRRVSRTKERLPPVLSLESPSAAAITVMTPIVSLLDAQTGTMMRVADELEPDGLQGNDIISFVSPQGIETSYSVDALAASLREARREGAVNTIDDALAAARTLELVESYGVVSFYHTGTAIPFASRIAISAVIEPEKPSVQKTVRHAAAGVVQTATNATETVAKTMARVLPTLPRDIAPPPANAAVTSAIGDVLRAVTLRNKPAISARDIGPIALSDGTSKTPTVTEENRFVWEDVVQEQAVLHAFEAALAQAKDIRLSDLSLRNLYFKSGVEIRRALTAYITRIRNTRADAIQNDILSPQEQIMLGSAREWWRVKLTPLDFSVEVGKTEIGKDVSISDADGLIFLLRDGSGNETVIKEARYKTMGLDILPGNKGDFIVRYPLSERENVEWIVHYDKSTNNWEKSIDILDYLLDYSADTYTTALSVLASALDHQGAALANLEIDAIPTFLLSELLGESESTFIKQVRYTQIEMTSGDVAYVPDNTLPFTTIATLPFISDEILATFAGAELAHTSRVASEQESARTNRTQHPVETSVLEYPDLAMQLTQGADSFIGQMLEGALKGVQFVETQEESIVGEVDTEQVAETIETQAKRVDLTSPQTRAAVTRAVQALHAGLRGYGSAAQREELLSATDRYRANIGKRKQDLPTVTASLPQLAARIEETKANLIALETQIGEQANVVDDLETRYEQSFTSDQTNGNPTLLGLLTRAKGKRTSLQEELNKTQKAVGILENQYTRAQHAPEEYARLDTLDQGRIIDRERELGSLRSTTVKEQAEFAQYETAALALLDAMIVDDRAALALSEAEVNVRAGGSKDQLTPLTLEKKRTALAVIQARFALVPLVREVLLANILTENALSDLSFMPTNRSDERILSTLRLILPTFDKALIAHVGENAGRYYTISGKSYVFQSGRSGEGGDEKLLRHIVEGVGKESSGIESELTTILSQEHTREPLVLLGERQKILFSRDIAEEIRTAPLTMRYFFAALNDRENGLALLDVEERKTQYKTIDIFSEMTKRYTQTNVGLQFKKPVDARAIVQILLDRDAGVINKTVAKERIVGLLIPYVSQQTIGFEGYAVDELRRQAHIDLTKAKSELRALKKRAGGSSDADRLRLEKLFEDAQRRLDKVDEFKLQVTKKVQQVLSQALLRDVSASIPELEFTFNRKSAKWNLNDEVQFIERLTEGNVYIPTGASEPIQRGVAERATEGLEKFYESVLAPADAAIDGARAAAENRLCGAESSFHLVEPVYAQGGKSVGGESCRTNVRNAAAVVKKAIEPPALTIAKSLSTQPVNTAPDLFGQKIWVYVSPTLVGEGSLVEEYLTDLGASVVRKQSSSLIGPQTMFQGQTINEAVLLIDPADPQMRQQLYALLNSRAAMEKPFPVAVWLSKRLTQDLGVLPQESLVRFGYGTLDEFINNTLVPAHAPSSGALYFAEPIGQAVYEIIERWVTDPKAAFADFRFVWRERFDAARDRLNILFGRQAPAPVPPQQPAQDNVNQINQNPPRQDQSVGTAVPRPLTALEDVAVDAVSDVVVGHLGLSAQVKDTVIRALRILPDVVEFLTQRLFDGLHTQVRVTLTIESFPLAIRSFIDADLLSRFNQAGAGVQRVWNSLTLPIFRVRGYSVVARMDVKNLRGVNDVIGVGGYTALGDYLLRVFAKEVLGAFPAGDFELVRVGGDEYMLFARSGVDASGVEEKINAILVTTRMLYKTVGGIQEYPVQVEFKQAALPVEERMNDGGDWLKLMERPDYSSNEAINQAKNYHPLLAYIDNELQGVFDFQRENPTALSRPQMTDIYRFLQRFVAVLLFDDVLRDKASSLQTEFRRTNQKATVAVFEDVRDFVQANRQEFPEGVRLIRLDYPGILKFLNKISSSLGDRLITAQFEKFARFAFSKLDMTNIRIYRRANELYLATEPTVSITDEQVRRAMDGYFVSGTRLFRELAVVSQTVVGFDPVGADGAGESRNIEVIGDAFDRLAGYTTTATNQIIIRRFARQESIGQQRLDVFNPWDRVKNAFFWLGQRFGRFPTFASSERQFLIEYMNPFDKRGSGRIHGIGATDEEIAQLKVHYKDLGDGAGEVVSAQGAYDALVTILKRIDGTAQTSRQGFSAFNPRTTEMMLVVGDAMQRTWDSVKQPFVWLAEQYKKVRARRSLIVPGSQPVQSDRETQIQPQNQAPQTETTTYFDGRVISIKPPSLKDWLHSQGITYDPSEDDRHRLFVGETIQVEENELLTFAQMVNLMQLEPIAQDIRARFPGKNVGLRGIITSFQRLSGDNVPKTLQSNDVMRIDELLQHGTEKSGGGSINIAPIGRGPAAQMPNPVIEYMVSSTQKFFTGASAEAVNALVPAVVVYDMDKMEHMVNYQYFLPSSEVDRRSAILGVYLIDKSEFPSEYRSDVQSQAADLEKRRGLSTQSTETEQIQAELREVSEVCPIVDNILVSGVYAADGSPQSSGCLSAVWKVMKRPPIKVIGTVALVTGGAYGGKYLAALFSWWQGYRIFLDELRGGHAPPDASIGPSSPFAFIDTVCGGDDDPNGLYEVDSNPSRSSEKPAREKRKDCTWGCRQGQCLAPPPGIACNEDGRYLRRDGQCFMTCEKGVVTEGSSCDHIDVIANNNILFGQVHRGLSLLPAFLFDGIRAPFIMNPTTLPLGVEDAGGYADCFREINGNTYCFSEVTLQDAQTRQDAYWITRYIAIHEFFHIWSNVQQTQNYAKYEAYVQKTGCRDMGDGKFDYAKGFEPVTGYDDDPQKIPCFEDFADTAAEYVMTPCALKEQSQLINQSQERYEIFRDEIFEGREYIPAEGCGN